MAAETPLNVRYQEILGQVVSDYIASAQPVASRQISKRIEGRLSPATIRNVLKDLEEMGYLAQPHTSAGRIPTDRGLRYYVDTLVEKHPLSEEVQNEIRKQTHLPEAGIRTLLQRTGLALSRLSKYVSLVATPKLEQTVFKHIEFLPLSRRRLLGIFVLQNGLVENQILQIPEELNYRDLEKINNYCNTFFYSLTLEAAREKMQKELARAHKEYDKLLTQALLFSQEFFGEAQGSELVVGGQSCLLENKNFATVEKIRELLASLEEKQQILNILDSCLSSPGVRIFIGAESRWEAIKDYSLITSTYTQGDRLLGTLGVLGPTRMDYSRVISMVDFTAKMVSDALAS